ncbi:MAG: tetratricopeptide repeat protein [Acidobacteria bacterium]|nr:tetratricopeptide repeat protein [Acidobacteriota bacterium]
MKLNQNEKAEALFKQAMNFNLTKGAALAGMGDLALANRNYAVAILSFEQALTEMPEATELYYPLAQAYRGLGDLAKAEENLAKRGTGNVKFGDELMAALGDLTSGAHAHVSRGSRLMSAQKYDEANDEFRLAVETDPENITARINYASTFVLLNKYDEAKTQLNELLRRSPNYAKAHQSLGILAAQLGNDEEAVKHFRAGLAVDKNLADANLVLGDALMRLKKYSEAEAAYWRQMELTPRNPSPHMKLVPALIRQKKFADARDKMENLVKGLPKHRDVMMVMVRLLAACPDSRVRDGKRAVALAEEKLSTESRPVYVQTMAMAYAEAGEFAKAVEQQRKALEAVESLVKTGSENLTDLVKMLKEDLALYERQKPCRRPWVESDPIFFPARPA